MEHPALSERNYKVLLVDDMPSNLQVLGIMLKKFGYRIFLSQSGEEALRFLENNEPDLILLDIMMPGIDGIEVCRRLKADPTKKHIPVIFISAVEDISKKVLALEVGGEDYITKPFSEKEVMARVGVVFQRREYLETIQHAEYQYQELVFNSPIPMLMISLDHHDIMPNNALMKLTGTAHPLMVNYLDEENNSIWHRFLNELMKGGKPDNPELRFSFPGGQSRNMKILYQLAVIQNREYFQLSFQDITQFKVTESIKNNFISTASHELRTPLTSIKGYAHSIRKYSDMDRKTMNSFLDIILEESDRLESMVRQMLDLSRIDSGNSEMHIERFNIFDLMKGMVYQKDNEYPQTYEFVDTDGKGRDAFFIHSDQSKVIQILENLLSNAAKYSDPGSSVRCSISSSEDTLSISVKDSGAGIPASELENIFNRFYRIEKHKSTIPGTGLGLAISRELAQLLGAELTVESTLGEGSRFTLLIPQKEG